MIATMGAPKQQFGGGWTAEKLLCVQKYIRAYATIMNKQPFRFAYIDAFAGTGYSELQAEKDETEILFPELAEPETQRFLEGSARIALKVRPLFDKYVFIEKSPRRFAELSKLKEEFSALKDRIEVINAEANAWLLDRCENYDWKKHRAVLFLDPFGMQVSWKTIEAIGKTKAIDLWLLFPAGVGVNRLLTRTGRIRASWRNKLDDIFGASDWFDVFYRTGPVKNLFGEELSTEKIGSLDAIGVYFVKRLETAFAKVAQRPLPLRNSTGSPLFLLCFAAANPAGASTAVKIAQDIITKMSK
jgi:three-Cys-motif partner protein